MGEPGSAPGNGASGLNMVVGEMCRIIQSSLDFTWSTKFSPRPGGKLASRLRVRICRAENSPAAGWAVRGAGGGMPLKAPLNVMQRLRGKNLRSCRKSE